MNVNTYVRRLAAGSMLALAATALIGAGAAQAGPPTKPYYCSAALIDATSGYGACFGGSGSFRGKVFCQAPDGVETVAYGWWLAPVGVPRQSVATCEVGTVATAATFETSENPVIDDPTP